MTRHLPQVSAFVLALVASAATLGGVDALADSTATSYAATYAAAASPTRTAAVSEATQRIVVTGHVHSQAVQRIVVVAHRAQA